MPQARLKFVWGVYEDGDWTPISLPWLTITLMDFDCGSRRSECERVTSAEHSHYEAGSEVDVHVQGSDTVFEDTMISNAEKQSAFCGFERCAEKHLSGVSF